MFDALVSFTGSSPPTRGTHKQVHPPQQLRRFIPAYAGNTFPAGGQNRLTTVHPRLRGEHTGGRRVDLPEGGSSPPTRGTRRVAPGSGSGARFIPAYAGNTAQLVRVWRR